MTAKIAEIKIAKRCQEVCAVNSRSEEGNLAINASSPEGIGINQIIIPKMRTAT